MAALASGITSQSTVCSTVCSDWQQRNIKGPHKGTLTRKMFDNVIMILNIWCVFQGESVSAAWADNDVGQTYCAMERMMLGGYPLDCSYVDINQMRWRHVGYMTSLHLLHVNIRTDVTQNCYPKSCQFKEVIKIMITIMRYPRSIGFDFPFH